MACTGFAALCFGVTVRFVLLVDGSGLEQLAAWAEELWGLRSPVRQSWLWQTPLGWTLQRPVGLWGWADPAAASDPGLLTPFSGSVRLEKPLEIIESDLLLSCSAACLHCQVQFISLVLVTVKAWSGLGWSQWWFAVSLGYPGVLSGSLVGPASAGNMQGEEGWEQGGAVSQPPARGILVSVSHGCAPGCQLPPAPVTLWPAMHRS